MMQIKEILLLHHSHFDVGYTHSQPIVWQLQYEFIEQALQLLDATSDWDDYSKPRWTCEVTAQVIKWLESANDKSIAKFKKYVLEINCYSNCTGCFFTWRNNYSCSQYGKNHRLYFKNSSNSQLRCSQTL